jgi:hypothetical protein
MSLFVTVQPCTNCELLNSIHGGHGQGKRSFLGAAPPVPEAAPEPLPTVLRAPSRATGCCLLGLRGRRRRGRPLRRRQAHGSDTETSPSVRSKPPCLFVFSNKFSFSPGGQVREERHGGRFRLRPGVRPGGPVPRHAPPPGISHRHRRSNLVSCDSYCIICSFFGAVTHQALESVASNQLLGLIDRPGPCSVQARQTRQGYGLAATRKEPK